MITCIGWGSLIWDRRNLDVDGHWRVHGPLLPVEFARQSSDGRITLVIVHGFAPVPTLWSAFNTRNIVEARESLRQRERIPRSRASESIAHWCRGENATAEVETTIPAWVAARDVEAAVWTNLRPKFADTNGRIPTESDVVAYLQALEGETQAAAEEYVRRAPRQIATAYRRAIERALGWTPVD